MLRAVDDLLVEVGYSAMTMKGIAERAGVGRQTVYRWWASKAEILLEASAADAERELAVEPQKTAHAEVSGFLRALVRFLTESDAGLAYRALIGEAQHDQAVAALLHGEDVLGLAARRVIRRVQELGALSPTIDDAVATAELVGPIVFRILVEGWSADSVVIDDLAARFLDARPVNR